MKKSAMSDLMNLRNIWNVLADGTFGLACLFNGAIFTLMTAAYPFLGIDTGYYRRDPYNYQRYGTGTPIPAG